MPRFGTGPTLSVKYPNALFMETPHGQYGRKPGLFWVTGRFASRLILGIIGSILAAIYYGSKSLYQQYTGAIPLDWTGIAAPIAFLALIGGATWWLIAGEDEKPKKKYKRR